MSDNWCLIVATGPSFQRDDADLLRPHVDYCMTINCGVFFVPWADEVFAGDAGWWRYYGPKLNWYKGQRWSRTYKGGGVHTCRTRWPRTGGNSGHMGLIRAFVDLQYQHIALLGFDHQATNGAKHVHADHPREMNGSRTNLGNVDGIAKWPRLMALTAADLQAQGATVINLSRETALTCFPRLTPEQFVEERCH